MNDASCASGMKQNALFVPKRYKILFDGWPGTNQKRSKKISDYRVKFFSESMFQNQRIKNFFSFDSQSCDIMSNIVFTMCFSIESCTTDIHIGRYSYSVLILKIVSRSYYNQNKAAGRLVNPQLSTVTPTEPTIRSVIRPLD